MTVQERSLELAQELARQNKVRVEAGQNPPLDSVQAEAEVAQRREGLIRATALAQDAEDALRRLIIDPAVGLSTTFLVTQAQRDLLEAEVNLLQATLDNQSALVTFDAVQQAPPLAAGSTLGIRGADVVALPTASAPGHLPARRRSRILIPLLA